MVIVDAIKSSGSEHAVFFLVTAYLESLRHFRASNAVPDYVVRLPLHGEGDLRERMEMIEQNTETRQDAAAPIREASTVFRCALEKLAPLRYTTPQ